MKPYKNLTEEEQKERGVEDYLSKEEREKYDKYCIESDRRLALLKEEMKKHNEYYIKFDRRIERLKEEMDLLIHCKTLWETAEKLIQSDDPIEMGAGKKAQLELVSKGIVVLLPNYVEEEMKKAI